MLQPVLIALVLGSGLVAGIFFAFSTFVMAALARLPLDQGVAAMRAINVAVFNPWFMGAFFGTALAAALVVLGDTVHWWASPRPGWAAAGAAVYLLGAVGVTLVFSVPLNEALARAEPDALRATWDRFLASWTAWNHVRTVAALAASACFTVAAVR